MGAIANDGKLMLPLVVDRVLHPDGSLFHEYKPLVRGRPVSPQTARKMRLMLREVCRSDPSVPRGERGTGTAADVPGYEVAGKTGTAQKRAATRNASTGAMYSRTIHTATFSGFFPTEEPRYVITVVVDEATVRNSDGFRVNAAGGTVAAPAFAEVVRLLVREFAIPPVTDAPSVS